LTFGKNYDKIIIESKGGGKTPTEKNFKRNLKKPLTSPRKCAIMNTESKGRGKQAPQKISKEILKNPLDKPQSLWYNEYRK